MKFIALATFALLLPLTSWADTVTMKGKVDGAWLGADDDCKITAEFDPTTKLVYSLTVKRETDPAYSLSNSEFFNNRRIKFENGKLAIYGYIAYHYGVLVDNDEGRAFVEKSRNGLALLTEEVAPFSTKLSRQILDNTDLANIETFFQSELRLQSLADTDADGRRQPLQVFEFTHWPKYNINADYNYSCVLSE
jgi:hypothetical protein